MRRAAKYTVRQGVRYKADLILNGWEAMASNRMILKKLTGYGFADVMVLGAGRERCAYGTWTGKDTVAEMPKQVSSVQEATA